MSDVFTPTELHAEIRNLVRTFAEKEVAPQAEAHDRAEKFNLDLFHQLGELDLLGVTVDDQYGGAGLDATAAVIVHEELSAADAGFTLAYLAHAILFCHNLYINGTDEQRQKWLPDACSGKKLGAMCMSEPDAGTDVLGMRTKAVRDGDHYVLTGTKMWITNGAYDDGELGDLFLVYARSSDKPRDISLFVVEKGTPGLALGQRIHGKLGMRASPTAEVVFDKCRVPVGNRLHDEGKALIAMMRNLEIERLTLAAMSLGIARRCIEIMNRYAQERHSFGKPLNHYGQIQRHIAESYAEYMAGRSYVYQVANHLSVSKAGNRIDSDGVKLYCSTMAKNVADRAIQVLGGYGYVGEYQVERFWRDAKLLEIGGGTIEAHQKNITRDLTQLDKIR